MSTRIPERPKLWEGLVTTLVYGWLVAMVVVFAALALASVFDGELWTRPTENVDAIAMVGAGVVLLSIGFVIGALTAHSEARDTAEAEAQATAIAHEREVRHWKAAKDDLLEQRRSEKEWDARSRRHDRVYEIEARLSAWHTRRLSASSTRSLLRIVPRSPRSAATRTATPGWRKMNPFRPCSPFTAMLPRQSDKRERETSDGTPSLRHR